MNVLGSPDPDFMREEEIVLFSDSVAKWIDEHAPQEKFQQWIAESSVPRGLWNAAGEAGLLGLSLPEEDGGFGGDYRHEVVLMRQLGWKGADHFGISLHNAIVMPYVWHYGTAEQKARWLPRLQSGELVGAIAMTEPGAGSDLQGVKTTAVKQGDHYVLNGSKTFITNGQLANFIIVVAKTDPAEGAKGTSLICLETDGAEGFERGRNLHKIGMEANDTSELFFNDVKVPLENVIGDTEGQGFVQLMQQLPQERLNIAVQGVAAAERGLEATLAYVKERKAFGKRVIDFQNTQFKLAEIKTKLTVAKVFVDHCIGLHLKGQLDAATASMAKYWVTDIQGETIDEMLQLFGGYGYMTEYPIAQLYKDARVQRIYGGTNEIMKLLIARTL
ncbi:MULTISPECIES: acyl-CoA dehydrogenase family protein [Brevundimonas]|uniref:acyl-CoA dehydrogenase family protein n=1 Tax=Brevundimonas TaxID=41275 RepID=UPI000F799961|nr:MULTISPECIES: acyl-CoA dehydrogenase family protein [Brevundimonas]MDA0744276.1 acyl-CoA dehydrogenase family protein [Pseudomonadota bacterium]MBK1969787.1 acyl-CoA dehydrogenase family protein [Brevundimonas diminuta]MBK1976803.1 acyl-CoA dehydrogenase family protein [Brevundimonas diminuta]MDA1321610.1 acyl-CoA dehydrogenase family protein [Pseudomonadota bacterium]MDM8353921.1 acyl-CoA dehydrogenase family protein [Brevundimonas diminuta]